MAERTLTLTADTAIRLDNLARRLGQPLDTALTQIASRLDVMDRIAAMLAQEIVVSPTPLRLRPPTEISDEIALISVQGNQVLTRLPHASERFCATVKGLGYRWDGQWWGRIIPKFAEPVADRAVELGVQLLEAGFVVEVASVELHRRIAASEYTPEMRTWVSARTTGKFAGWFCIQWDRNGRDYFRPASLIRGARCYPGAALIPAPRYDEVLDFAEVHGFAISNGALDLAAKAKRERDAMLLVTPQVRRPEPAPEPNAELAVEGILDELADEPL